MSLQIQQTNVTLPYSMRDTQEEDSVLMKPICWLWNRFLLTCILVLGPAVAFAEQFALLNSRKLMSPQSSSPRHRS